MSDHDTNLARAFDGQAARFERAPVQTDPVLLERLIRMAGAEQGLAHQSRTVTGTQDVRIGFQGRVRVLGIDLSPTPAIENRLRLSVASVGASRRELAATEAKSQVRLARVFISRPARVPYRRAPTWAIFSKSIARKSDDLVVFG
jgi:hypothetical protein